MKLPKKSIWIAKCRLFFTGIKNKHFFLCFITKDQMHGDKINTWLRSSKFQGFIPSVTLIMSLLLCLFDTKNIRATNFLKPVCSANYTYFFGGWVVLQSLLNLTLFGFLHAVPAILRMLWKIMWSTRPSHFRLHYLSESAGCFFFFLKMISVSAGSACIPNPVLTTCRPRRMQKREATDHQHWCSALLLC